MRNKDVYNEFYPHKLFSFFHCIYFFLTKEQYSMHYQNLFNTSFSYKKATLMIILSNSKGTIKSHKY